jgi:hypothetical protein
VEVFRRFFDAIVEQCQQEKLLWGRELYIDSTQVNANADVDSLTPRFAVEARAAIQTHLAALFSEEESQQAQPQAATEVVAASPEATAPEVVTCTVPLALPVVLSQAGSVLRKMSRSRKVDKYGTVFGEAERSRQCWSAIAEVAGSDPTWACAEIRVKLRYGQQM